MRRQPGLMNPFTSPTQFYAGGFNVMAVRCTYYHSHFPTGACCFMFKSGEFNQGLTNCSNKNILRIVNLISLLENINSGYSLSWIGIVMDNFVRIWLVFSQILEQKGSQKMTLLLNMLLGIKGPGYAVLCHIIIIIMSYSLPNKTGMKLFSSSRVL